jgi:retron-type reverse transcriptase
MKRYGNLWHQIVDFENILIAARKAERGKRFQPNVLEFNYHLEENIWQLKTELETKTYQPGSYCTFQIHQPKQRMISAAPYRDRVVHHALCNIISPIFEGTFIDHSYANRSGFGTHRALRQFTKYIRHYPYVLQCDIYKYFPSIDLEILKTLIRRKIKCHDTLHLIDLIIDNSNQQQLLIDYFPGDDLLTPITRRKGLPLGNLTSQFFANLYLSQLDHFIQDRLQIGTYLRYVDDFALFGKDPDLLAAAKIEIIEYLVNLRLKLHPVKSQLLDTKIGVNFLGFRVFPVGETFPKETRIRVRNENLRRGRRRVKLLKEQLVAGQTDFATIQQSLQSWSAHLAHGDTWRLQQQIFTSLVF